MSDRASQPIMDWSTPALGDAFKLFRQRCNLYFSVKDIKPEKQVDHILLLVGEEGLNKYNSWTFADEADRQKPEEIWKKFEEQLEPRQNFRIARFYLQKFQQRKDESIDDFLARCRLQAKNCRFRDAQETEERLIEQIITGTPHTELQKELLSKTNTLTLGEALNQGRTHEASLTHMRQLAEMQNRNSQEIDAIKHVPNAMPCKSCGSNYAHRREKCPAWGTTCSACGRQNHWAKVCFTNQRKLDRRQYESKKKGGRYVPREDRSGQKYWKSGNASKTEKIHNIVQDQQEDGSTYDQLEQLSFDMIQGEDPRRESRSEAFATVDITLPNRPGTHKLKAKVDTGAEGNTLPLRTFQRMFPENLDSKGIPLPGATKTESTVLTAYNGSVITQYGSVNIRCSYESGEWKNARFYVVETAGPTILGLPTLTDLQLVTLHCNITETNHQPIKSTQELIDMYPEQFDKIGNFAGEYHIVLRPDAQPVIHAPRKCPIHMKDEIKNELEEMTRQGIIRKVDEPTDWVNSLVYARKSNGKLRLCLDPKELNKAIKRCHHKTPTMEELTHKFAGARCFSKMDAKNGYWSVKLDTESQLLTTFNSPFGRYCFQRMAFGLVMSQDVFQQKMDQILEKCPGTLGIADDVAVYGKTQDEHDQNLHNLMKIAQAEGLMFNSDKCRVDQKQIHFFGAIYDKEGMHPDPGKVEDIKTLPSPSNVKELQEILGIITYMAPFIPKLADLTAPMRELLKKDRQFCWTSSHEKSLQQVKEAISEEVALTYFDLTKETVIQVDASSKGLGAALIQEGKPIAFASKSLTSTEQRYANIERELLAVVFGCERFHTYIYGRKFSVESDHKPLEMISLKNLVAAPPRLQRMLLRLQGYDLRITYRPGPEMVLADGFSRLPNKRHKETINLDLKVEFVQFSSEKLANIRQETEADTVLTELRDMILRGWPESYRDVSKTLRPYWSYRDELSIENGIVLKGGRILIPQSMQQEILQKIHFGHQGAEKCKLRAKSCVFWHGINGDIDQIVHQCSICQEHQKRQSTETLMPHEIPVRSWQIVATDLFHFDGQDFLLVVDYYSKFPFVRKLNSYSSQTVVQLTKQLFGEQGIPERVISDNGPHYNSSVYRDFSKEWGFQHITSSPRYAQSNGFVERCVQSVKLAMRKAEACKRDMDMVLLCLRSTPIDHVIPSPGELLYNRKLFGNLPVKCTNNQQIKDEVCDRLHQRQASQKLYHDHKAHDLPPLHVGQKIRMLNQEEGRWTPALVTEICREPRSYMVQTPTGQTFRRNRIHLKDDQSRTVAFASDRSAPPSHVGTRDSVECEIGRNTTSSSSAGMVEQTGNYASSSAGKMSSSSAGKMSSSSAGRIGNDTAEYPFGSRTLSADVNCAAPDDTHGTPEITPWESSRTPLENAGVVKTRSGRTIKQPQKYSSQSSLKLSYQ